MTQKRMEWLWNEWFYASDGWLYPGDLVERLGPCFRPDTYAMLEQTWAMFQGLA